MNIKKIRYHAVFVKLIFMSLCWLPFRYLFGRRSHAFLYRYAQVWMELYLRWTGTALKVQGLGRVDWDRPCVFLSNHLSYLDFALPMVTAPVPMHFIATKGLRKIPMFGRAMELLGMVFVNRQSPLEAKRNIDEAVTKVKQGWHVFSFPEGRISHNGQIEPFKKGLFYLAIDAQVPIVPVVIRGADKVFNIFTMENIPGEVELEYLDAVDTKGYGKRNIAELMELVRQRMLTSYAGGILKRDGRRLFREE